MNLLDWIFVVILVLTTFIGFRKGAISMVLTVASIFVAMWLSAQFAERLVGAFTDSIDNDALATAIGYVVIFVGVFIIARIVGNVLRAGLSFTMLGWTDRLAGIGLGVVAGVVLALALTMVTARYTYVFESSESGDIIDRAEDFVHSRGRERFDGYLMESGVVPVLIDIRNAVPARVIGLVPGDFNSAMDILEKRRA